MMLTNPAEPAKCCLLDVLKMMLLNAGALTCNLLTCMKMWFFSVLNLAMCALIWSQNDVTVAPLMTALVEC